MSTLVIEHDRELRSALKKSRGTATVGDVVAATGLPNHEVEAGLKALLETHEGHLAVSDSGELVYQFDEKLIERDFTPAFEKFRRATYEVFKKVFKASIVVVLVGYFVLFVALVIAALLAKRDDNGGGWGDRRGGHHHGGGLNNFFFWYWIMGGPRWRLGDPYYGRRWAKTLPKEARVPFYKKVFAFVFGPDEPKLTLAQKDRSTLRLIRARRGVLSAGELVEHTALALPDAESEMGRLMASHGGEPVVTPEGEVVYAFPELMTSAHGRVKAREPNPAWMRMEYPKEVTGNDAGSNMLIGSINTFNLLAGTTAPWFIFPRLGLSGPLAFVGLVLIPVIFSVLFFGIPVVRSFGVARENRRIARRNVRRLLLGLVYRKSLGAVQWVGTAEAVQYVQARIKSATPAQIERELNALQAEFDADVDTDESGALRYRFPQVRQTFVASELTRKQLALEETDIGDIVYSSADDAIEAGERELANWDRELAAAEVDLSGYLPQTDNIGFEDDFDLVAFDEELARKGAVRA